MWAWQAVRFVDPTLLLFGAGAVFRYQLLGITVQVLVRLFPPQIVSPVVDPIVALLTVVVPPREKPDNGLHYY